MRNTQTFRGMAVWHPICLSSPEEMLKAYADPEVRKQLHDEAIEFKNGPAIGICSTWWDYMVLQTAVLEKNKQYESMTLRQIAKAQGKGIIDCFLDLAIEENLDTEWLHGENNVDEEAVAKILTYPNAIIGLSDGGAHVQFQSGFGFSTRLLSEWVREKKIMSLEQAVRRLTFESASTFGLYDRGLLRPGMVADIVIFDPDTVKPLPLEVLHDFPTGAKRIKEPAQGVHMTIVNGEILLEDGKHTGNLPGRVLRNTYYPANRAYLFFTHQPPSPQDWGAKRLDEPAAAGYKPAMNWLSNFVLPKIRAVVTKKAVPDNLWTKCPGCEQMLFHRELEANLHVCRNCGHHLRIGAEQRLKILFGDGGFTRIELPKTIVDPLKFRDRRRYTDRLREGQAALGAGS